MLAKASVSRPRRGRSPWRSRRSTTIAPQISLPCVRAFTITCGPATPLSNEWTYSTPVVDSRCGAILGAVSSTRIGGLVSVLMVVVPVAVAMRVGMVVGVTMRVVVFVVVFVVVPVIVIVIVVVVVVVVVSGAGVRAAFRGIAGDALEQPRVVAAQYFET